MNIRIWTTKNGFVVDNASPATGMTPTESHCFETAEAMALHVQKVAMEHEQERDKAADIKTL